MSEKVLVLMASYNGERYIREQLDSIIAQDYENWELVIQDDGSTDGTLEIIQEYCNKESRITLFKNESQYHGPYYNFHLLNNRFKGVPGYDFYMYSDQDDIWFPNKISLMISEIRDCSVPVLLHADMSLCNENGVVTDSSFNSIFKMSGRDSYNVFICHKIFGCNIMINKALFDSIPFLNPDLPNLGILSHDNLNAKFAAALGAIRYLSAQTMMYRRHGENVTGRSNYKRSKMYIIKRMFELDSLAKAHALTYNQSLIALNLLRKVLEEDDSKTRYLNEIDSAIRKGGFVALKFMSKHKVNCGRLSESISRRLILFSGLYKKHLIIPE